MAFGMIDHNLYIDLLSGYIMSNTENPTRPSISGEPAGRVFIQTGEKNMTKTKAEIKAKYPFRMRVYSDDADFITESRTIDPAGEDYDVAVRIGDRQEYRYGGTHCRWYKGNKLVAVYLSEFGTVYGPVSIAKGDHPSTKYVGGK